MITDSELLEVYERRLLELAFVEAVRFESPPAHSQQDADFRVVLKTPRGQVRLWGEIETSHLTRSGVHALLSQRSGKVADWILFAPHVGRPLGLVLREAGMNYLDRSGNCNVRIGQDYVASVEGRRVLLPGGRRGVRAAGARVLFALLAEKDLLLRPLREIGEVAGASRQAALDAVVRLQEAGMIRRDGRERAWLPRGRRSAFERWLGDYETVLRPWLERGRFRTSDQTPEDLDERLVPYVARARCLFGGEAAGYRLVSHYRGSRTAVHVSEGVQAFVRELRVLPDPGGKLTILRLPCEIAAHGAVAGTVHPLLVYAEMIHTGNERAREAASLVRRRFLPEFA